MPKLPIRTPRQIIAVLKHHGFELDYTIGSHYTFRHPDAKRHVIVAFHRKDIPKGTMRTILKQAGLSPEDL